MSDSAILLSATAAWCLLHSLLLDERCAAALGRARPAHRLLYNLFATLTLLPLLWLFRARPGELLWAWHGLWQIPRLLLLVAALALLAGGARAFDNRAFLGLRQLDDARAGRAPGPPVLSRAGILGRVRHPYYAAGVAVLVAGLDFTTSNVVWRAVFVVYLLVGAAVEERRLLRRFGDAYADYRRETPAFLPRLRAADRKDDTRHVP